LEDVYDVSGKNGAYPRSGCEKMSERPDNKYALKIKNLTVMRSGTKVIEDITLGIRKGDFVGLVGPNGGGKTSLLLTVLGILKPLGGEIMVFGNKPGSRANLGRIGWVPQAASEIPDHIHITVRELVNLGTLNHKNYFRMMTSRERNIVTEAINLVGLDRYENEDVSNLSGGQLQRAVIARALASNADFLILDEPMVGIDRDSKNSLLRLLDSLCHDYGKTILMVSHDISAISQATHNAIYLDGAVLFQGPSVTMPDLSEIAKMRGIENPHAGTIIAPKRDLFSKKEED
tara:strand:- start:1556 stop:2422 length:867 start_codon:yes stop_codon:yes gene_type:complete